MATKFTENIRMFQYGEVYDLENPYDYKDFTKNTVASHQIYPLGVESDAPAFTDTTTNKYSRGMRYLRGNGILDTVEDNYDVGLNDVLTISFYIKWQEANTTLHSWMQEEIYFFMARRMTNNINDAITNKFILDGFDVNHIEYQFMKIVVDNPAKKVSVQIENNPVQEDSIEQVEYNLATNSFIYIGIEPDQDFVQPAMLGISPIIDDFKLTIADADSGDSKKSAYNGKRAKVPLWTQDYKQHFSSTLKIY